MSNYAWIRENDGTWHRPMSAVELYTYAVSADGIPRLSVLPTIRVKLDKPESYETISSKFRKGFQLLYYQVPNASFRGVPSSKGPLFDAYYQSSTTIKEAQEWLKHSLEEKVVDAKDDIENVLSKELTRMGKSRIDVKFPSSLNVCIVYFKDGDLISEIGFVSLIQHYAFDGTGAYHLFNKLLDNVANDVDIPNENLKADPETPFLTCIPQEIINADHSKEMVSLAEGFTSPSKPESLKFAIRKARPHDEVTEMSFNRHYFTSEETTILLQKAKQLGVTISQLTQAAHLIALFSLIPADKSSKINYTGLVNSRVYANLAPPYYGNATAPYFNSFSCESFSPSILKGQLESPSDAQLLYQIAIRLSQTVKGYMSTALSTAYAIDLFTNQILANFDPSAPSPDVPLSFMLDGLLDRYIAHRFSGKGASMQVTDAFLILLDPAPLIQARTSTFDNRLSLFLSYNNQCYNDQEVGEMVKRWGQALQFVVEQAKKE